MARYRLLLADDSQTIQKVVNLTFADQGMDVATFPDGESAANALNSVNPDIVLADVNMPGMSGYRLCEIIRNDPELRHIPVLLLVGSFEPFDREEAERVGANGHMTKPFSSIAELVSNVDALLAHSATVRPLETAAEPQPDTTDIDSLYEKSFVEPAAGTRSEFGSAQNGLDDEMIQTSYVDADNEFVIEEDYYSKTTEEFAVNDLVGESFTEDAYAAAPALSTDGPEQGFAPGPFDSVAAEPAAPIEPAAAPTDWPAIGQFDETDLLEIPRVQSNAGFSSAGYGGQGGGPAITSLSPELIELIVDKVVERLSERGIAADAHSAPHS